MSPRQGTCAGATLEVPTVAGCKRERPLALYQGTVREPEGPARATSTALCLRTLCGGAAFA